MRHVIRILALFAALAAFLPAARAEGEVTVIKRNGERIQGRLVDYGARKYRIEVDGQVIEVQESEVERVVFGRPEDPSAEERRRILALVEWLEDRRELLALLDTPSPGYTSAALELRSLGARAVPVLGEELARMMRDVDSQSFPDSAETARSGPDVAILCLADLLVGAGEPGVEPLVNAARTANNQDARILALCGVGLMGEPGRIRLRGLVSPHEGLDLSYAAACALGELGDPVAATPLLAWIERGDSQYMVLPIKILGRLRVREAIPFLVSIAASQGEDPIPGRGHWIFAHIALREILGELEVSAPPVSGSLLPMIFWHGGSRTIATGDELKSLRARWTAWWEEHAEEFPGQGWPIYEGRAVTRLRLSAARPKVARTGVPVEQVVTNPATVRRLLGTLHKSLVMPSGGKDAYHVSLLRHEEVFREIWMFDYGEWGYTGGRSLGVSEELVALVEELLAGAPAGEELGEESAPGSELEQESPSTGERLTVEDLLPTAQDLAELERRHGLRLAHVRARDGGAYPNPAVFHPAEAGNLHTPMVRDLGLEDQQEVGALILESTTDADTKVMVLVCIASDESAATVSAERAMGWAREHSRSPIQSTHHGDRWLLAFPGKSGPGYDEAVEAAFRAALPGLSR